MIPAIAPVPSLGNVAGDRLTRTPSGGAPDPECRHGHARHGPRSHRDFHDRYTPRLVSLHRFLRPELTIDSSAARVRQTASKRWPDASVTTSISPKSRLSRSARLEVTPTSPTNG